MSSRWRRIGWQQMQVVVPEDWCLSKIGLEKAEGDLWLADAEMPRLQIRWLDTTKQKSVDPQATLERYLQQMERQARKRKEDFSVERDIKLIARGGRDVSSLECFRWQADAQTYGVIWYSRAAQRVTLAQVNGPLGDSEFKALAKQVLGSLQDTLDGDDALWTAYELSVRVPHEWPLLAQTMETGRTELKFGRGKDLLTINRYGLAAIALQRAGDLGDWAFSQRHKDWSTFDLARTEGRQGEHEAVTFRGPKKGLTERIRQRTFGFFHLPYPFLLSARTWHCAEANCLFLVEHLRDAHSDDLLDRICETMPPAAELLASAKG